MITRVRIAPFEHWCEEAKATAPRAFIERIGQFVTIDTASMQWHPDGFRDWMLVGDDLLWLQRVMNDPEANAMCEHLLEID